MGKRARSLLTPEEAVNRTQAATAQLIGGQHQYVLARIVEKLTNDSHLATKVLLLLESGQLKEDEALSTKGGERYHSQNKLRLLPRDHQLKFLTRVAPGLGHTLAKLGCGKPTEFLALVLNMDPSSAIFTKQVQVNFDRMLARAQEVGNWFSDYDEDNGSLEDVGFFKLVIVDSEAGDVKVHATHLQHASGQKVPLPAEMQVFAWKIEDNLNFSKASLVHGLQQCRCTQVFQTAGCKLEEPLKLKEVLTRDQETLTKAGTPGTPRSTSSAMLATPPSSGSSTFPVTPGSWAEAGVAPAAAVAQAAQEAGVAPAAAAAGGAPAEGAKKMTKPALASEADAPVAKGPGTPPPGDGAPRGLAGAGSGKPKTGKATD